MFTEEDTNTSSTGTAPSGTANRIAKKIADDKEAKLQKFAKYKSSFALSPPKSNGQNGSQPSKRDESEIKSSADVPQTSNNHQPFIPSVTPITLTSHDSRKNTSDSSNDVANNSMVNSSHAPVLTSGSSIHTPVIHTQRQTLSVSVLKESTKQFQNVIDDKENQPGALLASKLELNHQQRLSEIESSYQLQLQNLNVKLQKEISSKNQLETELKNTQRDTKKQIEELKQQYATTVNELQSENKLSKQTSENILSKINEDHIKILENLKLRHQQDVQSLKNRVTELAKELKISQESNQLLEQAKNEFEVKIRDLNKEVSNNIISNQQLTVRLKEAEAQLNVKKELISQAQEDIAQIKSERLLKEKSLEQKIKELELSKATLSTLSNEEKLRHTSVENQLNQELIIVREDIKKTKEREVKLQIQVETLSEELKTQCQNLEKRAKDIADELSLTQEVNRTLQQAKTDFEKVVKSLNTQVSEGKLNETQLKQQLTLAQLEREKAEAIAKQKNLELEQIKITRKKEEGSLKVEIQKLEKANQALTSSSIEDQEKLKEGQEKQKVLALRLTRVQADASIAEQRTLELQTQLNELRTTSTFQAQDLEKRVLSLTQELKLSQEAKETLAQAQGVFEQKILSLNTELSKGKINAEQLKQQLSLAQTEFKKAEALVQQKQTELEQIKVARIQQETAFMTEIQKLAKANLVLDKANKALTSSSIEDQEKLKEGQEKQKVLEDRLAQVQLDASASEQRENELQTELDRVNAASKIQAQNLEERAKRLDKELALAREANVSLTLAQSNYDKKIEALNLAVSKGSSNEEQLKKEVLEAQQNLALETQKVKQAQLKLEENATVRMAQEKALQSKIKSLESQNASLTTLSEEDKLKYAVELKRLGQELLLLQSDINGAKQRETELQLELDRVNAESKVQAQSLSERAKKLAEELKLSQETNASLKQAQSVYDKKIEALNLAVSKGSSNEEQLKKEVLEAQKNLALETQKIKQAQTQLVQITAERMAQEKALQSKIKSLESQNATLSTLSEEEKLKHAAELKRLGQELLLVQGDVSVAKQRESELQTELGRVNAESKIQAQSLSERAKRLDKELALTREANASLKQAQIAYDKKIEALNLAISKGSSSEEQLKKEVLEAQQKLELETQKVKQAQTQLEQITADRGRQENELTLKIKALEGDIESINKLNAKDKALQVQRLSSLTSEVQSLQQQLSLVNTDLSGAKQRETELQIELDRVNAASKAQALNLEERAKKLDKELALAREANASLKQAQIAYDKKIEALNLAISKGSSSEEQLKKEVLEAQQKLELETQKVKQAQTKLEQITVERGRQENELTLKIRALEGDIESINKLNAKDKALQIQRLSALNSEVQSLQQQLSLVNTDLSGAKQREIELQTELDRVNAASKAQALNLEERAKKLDKELALAREANASLKQAQIAYDKKIEALNLAISKGSSSEEQLKKEVLEAQQNLTLETQKVKQTQTKLEQITAEHGRQENELTLKIKALEGDIESINKLNAKDKALQVQRLSSLTSEVQSLQQQLSLVNTDLSGAKQRETELQTELDRVNAESKIQAQSLSERAKKLDKELALAREANASLKQAQIAYDKKIEALNLAISKGSSSEEQLKKEVLEAQQKLELETQKVKQAQTKLEQITVERGRQENELTLKIRALEGDIESINKLNAKDKALQIQRLSALNSEVQSLQQQLSLVNTDLSGAKQRETELQTELDRVNAASKAQALNLEERAKKLDKELALAREANASLKQTQIAYDKKIEALNLAISKGSSTEEQLKKEVLEAQQKLEFETQKVKQAQIKLEQIIAEHGRHENELTLKIRALEGDIESINKLNAKDKALQIQRLSALNSEVQSLQQQLSLVNTDLSGAKQRETELQTELDRVNAASKAQALNLEERAKKLDKELALAREANASLKQAQIAYDKKIEALNLAISKGSSTEEQLKKEVLEAQQKLELETQKAKQAQIKLEQITAERMSQEKALQSKIKNLESQNATFSTLSEEDKLKHAAELKRLGQELLLLQGDVSGAKQRETELQLELDRVNAASKVQALNLEERAKKLAEELTLAQEANASLTVAQSNYDKKIEALNLAISKGSSSEEQLKKKVLEAQQNLTLETQKVKQAQTQLEQIAADRGRQENELTLKIKALEGDIESINKLNAKDKALQAQKLSDLSSEVRGLQQQLSLVSIDLSGAKQRETELQLELDKINADSKAQAQRLEERAKKLAGELALAQEANASLTLAQSNYDKKIEALNLAISKGSSTEEQLKKEVLEAQQKLELETQKAKQAQIKLEQITAERMTQEKALQSKIKSLESQNATLSTLSEEDKLKHAAELKRLGQEFLLLQGDVSGAKQRETELQLELDRVNAASKVQALNLEERAKKLAEELTLAQEANASLTVAQSNYDKKIEALNLAISKGSSTEEQLKKEVLEAQQKLELETQKVKQAQLKLEQITAERMSQEKALQSKIKNLEGLNATLSTLSEEDKLKHAAELKRLGQEFLLLQGDVSGAKQRETELQLELDRVNAASKVQALNLEERAKKLAEELTLAQEANASLTVAQSNYVKKIEALNLAISKGSSSEEQLKKEVLEAQQKLELETQKFKQAQTKLEQITADRARQESSLTLKIKALDDDIESINKLNAKDKALQAQRLSALNSEVQSLQQQLNLVNTDLSGAKQRETELQTELDRVNAASKAQALNLEERAKKLAEELTLAQEANASLIVAQSNYDKKIEALNLAISKGSSSEEQLKKEVLEAQQKLELETQKVKQAQTKLEQITVERGRQENELTLKIRALEGDIESINKLNAKDKALQIQRLSALTSEVQSLQQQLSLINTDLSRAKQRETELQIELDRVDAESKVQAQNLEERAKRLDKELALAREANASLILAQSNYDKKIEALNLAISKGSSSEEQLKKEVLEAQQKLGLETQKAKQAQTKLEQITAERMTQEKALQSKIKSLESQNATLSTLLEEDKLKHAAELKHLGQELLLVQGDLSGAKQREIELQTELDRVNAASKAQAQRLEERAQKFEKELILAREANASLTVAQSNYDKKIEVLNLAISKGSSSEEQLKKEVLEAQQKLELETQKVKQAQTKLEQITVEHGRQENELTLKIKAFESDIESINKLNAKDRELQVQRLSALNSEVRDLQQQLSLVNIDFSGAKQRETELQTELDRVNAESKIQAQNLSERAKRLAEELKLSQESNASLKQAQIAYDKKIEALNLAISKGSSSEEQLKKEVLEAQQKLELETQKAKQAQIKLEQIIAERMSQENALQSKIKSLESQNATLSTLSEEDKLKHAAELKRLEQELLLLQGDVSGAKQRETELQLELARVNAESKLQAQNLEKRVLNLSQELKLSQEAKETLVQAQSEYKQKITLLNSALNKGSNTEEHLKQEITEAKEKLALEIQKVKQAQIKLEGIKFERATNEKVLGLQIKDLESQNTTLSTLSEKEKLKHAAELKRLGQELLLLQEDVSGAKVREIQLQGQLVQALDHIEADKQLKLELTAKLNVVTSALEAIEKEKDLLTSEVQSLNAANKELDETIESLNAGRQQMIDDSKALIEYLTELENTKDQYEKAELEIKNLNNQLEAANEKLIIQSTSLSKSSEKEEVLNLTIKRLTISLDKEKNLLSRMHNELAKQTEEYEKARNRLDSELAVNIEKNTKNEIKINNYIAQLNDANLREEKLKKQLEQLTSQNSLLKEHNSTLKDDNTLQATVSKEYAAEIEKLRNQLEVATNKIKKVEGESKELRKDLSLAQQTISSLHEVVIQQNEELEFSHNKIQELEQDLDHSTRQIGIASPFKVKSPIKTESMKGVLTPFKSSPASINNSSYTISTSAPSANDLSVQTGSSPLPLMFSPSSYRTPPSINRRPGSNFTACAPTALNFSGTNLSSVLEEANVRSVKTISVDDDKGLMASASSSVLVGDKITPASDNSELFKRIMATISECNLILHSVQNMHLSQKVSLTSISHAQKTLSRDISQYACDLNKINSESKSTSNVAPEMLSQYKIMQSKGTPTGLNSSAPPSKMTNKL